MDTTPIKELIQMYFDASYESDGEKMSKVFHGAAHIYGFGEDGMGGELNDKDAATFARSVGAHGPSTPGYPRYNEILSIDFTGESTAAARVKLRVRNTMFTDVLSLMRIDGKWGVISKLLSGVPAEA